MRGVLSLGNANKRFQKFISKFISEILFVAVLYQDISIIKIIIYNNENEWFDNTLPTCFCLSK